MKFYYFLTSIIALVMSVFAIVNWFMSDILWHFWFSNAVLVVSLLITSYFRFIISHIEIKRMGRKASKYFIAGTIVASAAYLLFPDWLKAVSIVYSFWCIFWIVAIWGATADAAGLGRNYKREGGIPF